MNKPDFLKRILRSKRVSYDKRIMHPTREWLIGLAFFTLIIGAGGAYSAQQFVDYRNITTEGGSSKETVKYNSTLIHNVLDQYRVRKEQFLLLKDAAPVVPEVLEVEDATSTEPVMATSTELEVVEEINTSDVQMAN